MKGIGGHQAPEGKNDEWLTPPEILEKLGEFDLDPCSPIKRPWHTAKKHLTIQDDGLQQNWEGRVWLNPPYNRYHIHKWLKKMADHKNGICLMFARTETTYFQDLVFNYAHSIFFLKGRLTFYDVKGKKAKANGGAPSVLISYTENDTNTIINSGLQGKLIFL
ncbi:DNA N-6-adenine-methyltransferase [Myroides odoratus]|uniref:DNA N-6-adenine-methyltransferase n=1 Tax=Myroides odoratus TaxID=256 RepID=UPI000765B2BE|nr:DNA N-6-adenine-methyltransferase [Myroides odoratus]